MHYLNSFLLLVIFSSISHGQPGLTQGNYSISYKDWSNPLVFRHSPEPLITGYGTLSDSLEKVHGSIFYELDGEYLAIESWADYYYWFTKKYDVLFRKTSAFYSTYYFLNDEMGMIHFVFFNQNYKGDYFPSLLRIHFENQKQVRRVLTYNRVRTYRGIPFIDEMGMYRPDLVERRWWNSSSKQDGSFSITSGRRSQNRREGSLEKSDN